MMPGTVLAIAVLSLALLIAVVLDVVFAAAWRSDHRDLRALQRRTWSPYEREDDYDAVLPPDVEGWSLGGPYGRTVRDGA